MTGKTGKFMSGGGGGGGRDKKKKKNKADWIAFACLPKALPPVFPPGKQFN